MSEFIENNFYTFLIFGVFALFVVVYLVALFLRVKKQRSVATKFAASNIGCAKVYIDKVSNTMASVTKVISIDGESEGIPVAYGYSDNYFYLNPGSHNVVVSTTYENKDVLTKKLTRTEVSACGLKVEVKTSRDYVLYYDKEQDKYIFNEKESS